MPYSRSTTPTPPGSKGPPSAPLPPPPAPTLGAKNLQDSLHILLSRLSKTTELVKDWPESEGDDSSIHAETTTQLIAAILDVISALQKVEGVIKADADLRKALQDCQVPINLLDLLDHGNGLNPDCFSRGLVKEALGQLKGLKRRKKALEMLGATVQAGLTQRDEAAAAAAASAASASASAAASLKRKLDDDDDDDRDGNPNDDAQMAATTTPPLEASGERPVTKKARTEGP